ncbi:MAG: hypothetical protein LBD08_03725 [Treponema sp.]|jgi:hypothetical protein|nr:hypothetical protein [Treponema sp.]
MRKELEPDMETVEKLYAQIISLIEGYIKYCDENGDEDSREYKKLEDKLHEITGKDISQYNLWEYWAEEGIDVFSFRIGLPEPDAVKDITKDELTEIVKKIQAGVFEENGENKSMEPFKYYLEEYYHRLLEIKFEKYEIKYFQRQKDKDGKYFEYSAEEITEKIWNKYP